MAATLNRRATDADLRKAMFSEIEREFENYGISMFANYPIFLRMVNKAMRRVMRRRTARSLSNRAEPTCKPG